MASKKLTRKTSTKKTLKKKPASKKKVTAKKGSTKASTKPAVKKKKAKVAKTPVKKKTVSKMAVKKKKVAAKKASTKKTKASSKEKVPKAVSKPRKRVKPSPSARKKKAPVTKVKVKSSPTKKSAVTTKSTLELRSRAIEKFKEPPLSSTERYNIGGLFACAIDRDHDQDFSRLRAVLHHLGLSAQEKGNLIHLSQGLMIPKLFAENLAEPKINQLLADLVKFAMKTGSYQHHWREEIQQVGFWLGIFPAQFQALEQQAKR